MHLQRLDLDQKLIAVRLVLVSFLAADTLFTVNLRWDTFSFLYVLLVRALMRSE